MSQVKNLRAMFEQKQDGSPPDKGSDRGRSPVGSAGTATPPPRPLSKVRTNFVAVVEKDGRVGLRRDPSSDSIPTTRSLSQRRLSVNTEEGSASVVSDRASNMALAAEAIPESPRQPEHQPASRPPNGIGNGCLLGALSDRPSHNPDKHIDLETPTPKLLPGDPTTDIPPGQPLTPAKNAPASKHAGTPKAAAKTAAASQEAPKPAATKRTAGKPNPVLTKPTSKPPAKSPSLPKTPTSLSRPASQPAAAKTQQPPKRTTEKPAATKTTTSAAAKAPAAKSASSTAPKKATPAPVSIPASSSTGFVKPKPKSPTRPVNIPSSLMAGTASSQSKVKNDTLAPKPGIGRSPSRASVSTTGGAPAKTIRRQRSSINANSRPSLGPPPKKTAQDHPVIKKERDVDEGFLARMARPTVSSASKVSDKAPVTPPRKAPTRAGSTGTGTGTGTGTRKLGAHSSLGTTGSPGSKKKPSNILGGGDEPVEVSNVEDVEVEEALRNATVIPEVAEPARVVDELKGSHEEVAPEPVVDSPQTEEAAPEETPAAEVPAVPETAIPGPDTTEVSPVIQESLAQQPQAEEPTSEDQIAEEPVVAETLAEGVAAEETVSAPEESSAPVEEAAPVENVPLAKEAEADPVTDEDATGIPAAHGKVDAEDEQGTLAEVSEQATTVNGAAHAGTTDGVKVPE